MMSAAKAPERMAAGGHPSRGFWTSRNLAQGKGLSTERAVWRGQGK